MTTYEFATLPEEPENIEIGEKFMSPKAGERREEFQIGQQITYYQIIKVINKEMKHYEYQPIYDVLTE
jgi:hypothetical protein